jgi:methyl-accepting chemotaxis protein
MKFMQYANKVSIKAKLSLFALVTFIAVSIPAYYLNQQANQNVKLASLSISGVPIAQKTVLLRKFIAKHRGTSARWLGGDDSARTTLVNIGADVDATFQSLLSDLKAKSEGVSASIILQKQYQSWTILKGQSVAREGEKNDIFNRHSQLIVDVGEVAASVLRNFKLIYAPSDSAYHLVMANFNALPTLTDTLGKIRGLGAGVLASQSLDAETQARLEGIRNNARSANLDFLRNLRFVSETSDDPRLKRLSQDANDFNQALALAMDMLDKNIMQAEALDFPSAEFFGGFTREIESLYKKQDQYVTELSRLLLDYSHAVNDKRAIQWLIIGCLLLLASFVFIVVNLSITSGISSLSNALQKLTVKEYDLDLGHKREDEIGKIQTNVESLTDALKAFSVLSVEAMRIRQALDKSSSCFMMADVNGEITYINEAMAALFVQTEKNIQNDLPQFSASNVLGKNISMFYPEHQLSHPYENQLLLGQCYFKITSNPIKSSDGNLLGGAVEWVDRSKEVNAEKDIAQLVEGAVAGDFTLRANTEGKADFHLTLAEGLNQLMEVTEQGLSEITQILMAIAKRDLTQRITRDFAGTFGEMKDYCNETADNLASVIGEIREASETITSGSGEIAMGNSDLSSRTEQQAANLEETASSMEQITSTVQLNAENAKRANDLASNASSVATEGGKLIEDVVQTMAEIHSSAARIADIIGVIDGIAFQTNILALNAAVEAARAGEQGRGFAVVASEVRTLAQRSANAAKDIKGLISDSVSKVESGNKLVNQSGATMGEIVEAISHVNEIMADIASSSAEQAAGIESINEAIVQMDEMTQQNAALVEEAAAAAESMNTQAKQLGQRVQTFDIGEAKHRNIESQQAQVYSSKKSAESQKSLPSSVDERATTMTQGVAKSSLIPADVDNEDEWESF